MLHHHGMKNSALGCAHMRTRHVMQFHKFLVCVHRINSRRRNEWSLEGFSYPIFINLLRILVLFCGMSGKIWWSFKLKISFTIVCVLSSCKPRKTEQIWFIYEKGEKWWKISRRKRSFSIRQISPAAHHALKCAMFAALHQQSELQNW